VAVPPALRPSGYGMNASRSAGEKAETAQLIRLGLKELAK